MNSLDRKDYYNILFAFYRKLFTPKQQLIFDCYYANDYSLSEIAEDLQVSRNAIWDTLKKVTEKLDEYEAKLSLYNHQQKLNEYLNELSKTTNEDGLLIIKKIREME